MPKTKKVTDENVQVKEEIKTAIEITEEQFEAREEVNEVPADAEVVDFAAVTDKEVNTDAVAEAIESVDTEIKGDEKKMEEIQSEIKEALKPIEELDEKIEEFKKEQELLQTKIEADPEKIEETIKSEIKKVEALKNDIEKKINNIPRKPDVTSWWNGMNYDF